MQVFISYHRSPADKRLAQNLADFLRRANIEPWLDVEDLPGGQNAKKRIREAIEASDHGIFVVSREWLGREWCDYELEQFARFDPEVKRRIAILRDRRQNLVADLSPRLVSLTCLEWLEQEDAGEPFGRWWEVYCAIHGEGPGPPAEWAAHARELLRLADGAPLRPVHEPPPTIPGNASLPVSQDRPSLRCDRGTQWITVNDNVVHGNLNQIAFVNGSLAQDVDHFVERIERRLEQPPPRNVVRVTWEYPPPSGEREFFEALENGIGRATGNLVQKLGRILDHSNLVVVHPCVRWGAFDEAAREQVKKYYVEYLPGILRKVERKYRLKCIQPIEWPAWPPLSALWKAFTARRTAIDLMESIEREQVADVLQVVRVPELNDITDDDLAKFCSTHGLLKDGRAYLLEQVGLAPQTPRAIFDTIDKHYSHAQQRERTKRRVADLQG
jgi:hypothetical protein